VNLGFCEKIGDRRIPPGRPSRTTLVCLPHVGTPGLKEALKIKLVKL